MNKILVTIYVISIDEEFDLFLPVGLKVLDALDIIQDSIVELSNNNYTKRENVNLYTFDGFAINNNNVVKSSGIKNGMKLLLM